MATNVGIPGNSANSQVGARSPYLNRLASTLIIRVTRPLASAEGIPSYHREPCSLSKDFIILAIALKAVG